MWTYDVRVLVRDGKTPEDVLAQLLTGTLRVHAAVLIASDPGESRTTPPRPPVPVSEVYRNPRSFTYYERVRDWNGGTIRPSRYRADRPHPEEYA